MKVVGILSLEVCCQKFALFSPPKILNAADAVYSLCTLLQIHKCWIFTVKKIKTLLMQSFF